MSIESIIESRPWVPTTPVGGGTITTVAGDATVEGAGVDFTTDVDIDDILVWDDGTGKRTMGQVASITDIDTLELHNPVAVAVVAAAWTLIKVADQHVPFFQADNTVINKPVIIPGGAGILGVNQASLFLSQITADQGVLVKSVFIRNPSQFTLGESPFLLNFNYFNNVGASLGAINDLGEISFFGITTENVEIPVNKYINRPGGLVAGDTWQIGINIDNGFADTGVAFAVNDFETATVSQVNAPIIYNTLLLPIFVGLRILHATNLGA